MFSGYGGDEVIEGNGMMCCERLDVLMLVYIESILSHIQY